MFLRCLKIFTISCAVDIIECRFANAFENAYCPPTSMVKDVVNKAADELVRRLRSV